MTEIRPIKEEELKSLNKNLVAKGLPNLHKQKLKEQKAGGSTWLVAWEKSIPIGHIQLRFSNKHLKNCAHIETLGVNEKYRKKGIASQLIKFAENLAKKEGHKRIGLSIETKNNFLKNLYLKRGYKDWGKGTIMELWEELDDKGKQLKKREKCNYLLKNLK